jgi:kumamolisin
VTEGEPVGVTGDGRVAVAGSERVLPATGSGLGPSTGAATVTVYLRRRRDGPATATFDDAATPRLRRDGFAATLGADGSDVDALRRFAAAQGLRVGAVHPSRRSVELHGSVADLGAAFGATLVDHRDEGGATHRVREGRLTVPSALAGVVVAVLGLDDRPQARTMFRRAAARTTGFTPPEVAGLYDFPAGSAAGQTVGLVELGGGYETADLTTYFAGLGIPAPSVTAVGVDGAANSPGADADAEVMLDIEVVGGVAPGVALAVYFAPNTDRGFVDVVTTAIHDTTNAPSVISISWGGSEDSWTAQSRDVMEQAFVDATALGVTVVVAAGDGGSTDGATDGRQHVDFPASAPHALACGGTTVQVADGALTSETVWDDGAAGGATGGGISDAFAVPGYQSAITLPPSANAGAGPGRGVPDVSGDADPATGYRVRVDGTDEVIGGTSAVAPLWAGLVALCNAATGTLAGFVHPRLYALPAGAATRDVTAGSNGSYSAAVGWDACSGLGSPIGTGLLAALRPTSPPGPAGPPPAPTPAAPTSPTPAANAADPS